MAILKESNIKNIEIALDKSHFNSPFTSDYILFNSVNNNHYFYSFTNAKILFIHPLISFFLSLSKDGINIHEWIKQNSKNTFGIKGIGTFSKKDIFYYYKKYIFLLNNNYFEKRNINSTYRYNEDKIKYYLANTSQISFEVTDRCNLNCEYCIYGKYYTNRNKPQNINLNIDIAKNVINYLVELWNSSINSSHKKKISIGFYGGEALLNMNFIYEIVDFVKTLPDKHFNFTFALTTNGVLLNKYIPFLVSNNFDIVISLDGGLESNNIYRKFHNEKPAFKYIYKNILAIKEKYPKYFDKNVNFISVLHNKNSFVEIYNFFLSKFDKTPLISELDSDSVNQDLADEFHKMQENAYNSLHEAKNYGIIEKEHYVGDVENLTKFLFSYSGFVKSSYLDLIFDPQNSLKIPTGTCEPFSRKIFVTSMGQIFPCERIGHQFALGYANKNEVYLDFNSIAKKYNEYFDNISNQCNICYLKNSCGICMFKQRIEFKDVQCTGFTNYKSVVDLFSQNISYMEQNPELYLKILTKINYI